MKLEVWSGKMVSLREISAGDIDLRDIAVSLSRQYRFLGHTRKPYSVAQHSVLVSHLLDHWDLDTTTVLWGLLHDAHEAYIGDISRPVRDFFGEAVAGMLKDLTRRIDAAVAEKLGVDLQKVDLGAVKEADNTLLYAEKRDLLGSVDWGTEAPKTVVDVPEISAHQDPLFTERMFLWRLRELTEPACAGEEPPCRGCARCRPDLYARLEDRSDVTRG